MNRQTSEGQTACIVDRHSGIGAPLPVGIPQRRVGIKDADGMRQRIDEPLVAPACYQLIVGGRKRGDAEWDNAES